MSGTLEKWRSTFRFAGLALATVALAAAFGLWPRQSPAPASPDNGAPGERPPLVLVEAVAPPRHDADGEHPVVRLVRRSPLEAWQVATALPESPERERLRRFVAVQWVERAPSQALAAFEAMDETRMPTQWMFEMLARWMAVDEDSALDWAAATAAGRPRVLMAGAIDWLLDHARAPEAALASAERMLRRWARRGPAAAWDVASADGLVGHTKVLLRGVAEVWFAQDPHGALDAAIADNEWQIMRRQWIADIVAGWARAVPREAADWVLGLPESSRDGRLLAAIHAPLSVAAPDEALAFVRKLGDGEARAAFGRGLYKQQLRRLLGDDPHALAEWLERQPDENLRTYQAKWIAGLLLEAAPDDALEWALGLPAKESGKALEAVIQAIAEEDPARAEDIVLSLSEADAQAGAAAGLLADWTSRRRQPAVAYQWAVDNLSTTVRQGVNGNFFWSWAITDPADALSALRGVADADNSVAAHTLIGMVFGVVGVDETPERLRTRMLAIERLYEDLMPDAPDLLGSDGDLPAYRLYHYWKETDPVRAAKYKKRAERYDGPTQ